MAGFVSWQLSQWYTMMSARHTIVFWCFLLSMFKEPPMEDYHHPFSKIQVNMVNIKI